MSLNVCMKRRDWVHLALLVSLSFGLAWLTSCAAQPKPAPVPERVIPPVGQTPPLCNYIEVRP